MKFGSAIMQAADLRRLLKGALAGGEGARLFAALHRAWGHSAGALLSLCLLARAYEHAARIVEAFAELPVTLEVLVQVPAPIPHLLVCHLTKRHVVPHLPVHLECLQTAIPNGGL